MSDAKAVILCHKLRNSSPKTSNSAETCGCPHVQTNVWRIALCPDETKIDLRNESGKGVCLERLSNLKTLHRLSKIVAALCCESVFFTSVTKI